MSVQVSYKKQVLFGIIFLIIVLAIIEGVVRFWWYEINKCALEESEVYKDLEPALKKKLCLESYEIQRSANLALDPDQQTETVHINAEGFRGSEITKQKPENTYRIFVIGGSTVYGFGATSDKTTISGYLQKEFDSSNLDFNVEVINGGTSGSDSRSEITNVRHNILNYEPDLLIIYEGYNDFFNNQGEIWINNNDVSDDKIEEFLRNQLSFYKTPFVIKYFMTLNEKSINSFLNSKRDLSESANIWKNNWAEICKETQENSIDVIVILQPVTGTSDRTLTEFEYSQFLEAKHDELLPAYALFVDALLELENYCTKTSDLRGAFDGVNEPIYVDSHHVGDFGNSIIAKKLFQTSYSVVEKGYSKISKISLSEPNEEKIELLEIDFLNRKFSKDYLSGKDLQKMSLTDLDLSELNLSNANLEEVDFSNTNLSGTDLSFANLWDANLTGANLTGANLTGANLHRANFNKASLLEADFTRTSLIGAVFSGANLSGTDMTSAILGDHWIGTVIFSQADLSEVDFSGLDMRNFNLTGTNLSGVDFTGTNLFLADLSYANLTKAILDKADLSDANLAGVDLSGVDLSGVDLSGVDLSGVDLSGVDLSGADLSGADFSGTNLSKITIKNVAMPYSNFKGVKLFQTVIENSDLSNSDFSKSELFGTIFIGSTLTGIDFSNANATNVTIKGVFLAGANLSNSTFFKSDFSGSTLSGADLSGANLVGSIFRGADLRNVNLSDANLSGADMTSAILEGANLMCFNHEICK